VLTTNLPNRALAYFSGNSKSTFPVCASSGVGPFRGKLFETQMSNRFGFLFLFVMLVLLGLFTVMNPKAAKKENADVPGFYKT
jgi:hypothetical protein